MTTQSELTSNELNELKITIQEIDKEESNEMKKRFEEINKTGISKIQQLKSMTPKENFTRKEVIQIINELLERPDMLIDAISNEYTDHDATTLLGDMEDVLELV